MFSVEEKQKIAKAVEDVIREINHPEVDNSRICFQLLVSGREPWSWAAIHENSRTPGAPPNPWNEKEKKVSELN